MSENQLSPEMPNSDNIENKSVDETRSNSANTVIPKQSGLKLPSKIGRPCAGILQNKPAIPQTPSKNSTDSWRNTDDFGRHKLTDVLEGDESEDDGCGFSLRPSSRRSKYSSSNIGTASSIDHLWDIHPRRLSEAGLVRFADSSTVLTEDTDSFIIGQRVWVGGTKPGTIAYIGETQFAPGEWAGIALDEPIGKNDGSVGGVHYFQCENKKGVFSRLTRLTRTPIGGGGGGIHYSDSNDSHYGIVTPSPPPSTFSSYPNNNNNNINNGVRKSQMSSYGSSSTRSLSKTPDSLSNSNTSLASSHVDFKIGERVIIKSSQGSKVGTCRYIGTTDFANGEWVGVELDEPRGKNNGSVNGVKYFDCLPNYGLFAPIGKISKSPLKYKPGNCVIHTGAASLPPSSAGSIRRANSKESLNSTASSVRRVRLGITSLTPKKGPVKPTSSGVSTRTALQDVLREKQQHIEQLLKDRDLERQQVTKAANIADNAEQRLSLLKQEYEHYRSECEAKIQDNLHVLSQLNVDKSELLNQLDEEKRRNEDLQFKFEEAAISKSDIEVSNEENLIKLKTLQNLLETERQKIENYELMSTKLFETEESLLKTREELEIAKTEQKDESKSQELIASLRAKLEQYEKEQKEKLVIIANYKSENEILKQNTSCKIKEDEITNLKLEKLVEENNQLVKENEAIKMKLSAKSHDLETVLDDLKQKETELETSRKEIELLKHNLESKASDLEMFKENLNKTEIELNKELDDIRIKLKNKITENETNKQNYQIEISNYNLKLNDANTTIKQQSKEIEKLFNEINGIKTDYQEKYEEIHKRHKRNVDDKEAQLMAFSAEIQQKNEEITKCTIITSKLDQDICMKNGIIDKLRQELEIANEQINSNSNIVDSLNKQLNDLQLMNGDLKRQFQMANEKIMEFTETKQHLEQQLHIMTTNSNEANLEQLNNEFRQREQLFEVMKMDLMTKLQNSERFNQELELKYNDLMKRYDLLQISYDEKLKLCMENEQTLKQNCDSSLNEIAKVRDQFQLQITQLQNSLNEKDRELVSIQEKYAENERFYKEELIRSTDELNRHMESCNEKNNVLTNDLMKYKEDLSMKSEELIEINAKYDNLLAQQEQNDLIVKQNCDANIRKIEFELNQKNVQLQQSIVELEIVKKDCKTHNVNLDEKDHKISELSVELESHKQLINKLQLQLNECDLNSKKELNLSENQRQNYLNEIAALSEKAQLADELTQKLEIEQNNFIYLMNQLKITEQQKQTYIKQLENDMKNGCDVEKCTKFIDLINRTHAITIDENTQKLLAVQSQLENFKVSFDNKNKENELQKAEILRLQNDLLQMQATCTSQSPSGQGLQAESSISVRTDNLKSYTNNTDKTQLPSLNTLKLQVELFNLQNSFNSLSNNFIELENENDYYINQLKLMNLPNIKVILNHYYQLKKQLHYLQNSMQPDIYNLRKVVQYSVLKLQNNENIIINQNNKIKQLFEILNNLPIQCQLYSYNHTTNFQQNDCIDLNIENRRINNLLKIKQEHIDYLKNQLSSNLNCKKEEKIVYLPCSESRPQSFLNNTTRIVTQHIPMFTNNCKLPNLATINLLDNQNFDENNLHISGFNKNDINKFKFDLLNLINAGRKCNEKIVCSFELPKINIPKTCSESWNIFDNINFGNSNPFIMESFKHNLIDLVSYVDKCSTSFNNTYRTTDTTNVSKFDLPIGNKNCAFCPSLPIIPDLNLNLIKVISDLDIRGFPANNILAFKRSLIRLYLKQKTMCSLQMPVLPKFESCDLGPLEVISRMDSDKRPEMEFYRQELFDFLQKQQYCCSKQCKTPNLFPIMTRSDFCLMNPSQVVNLLDLNGFNRNEAFKFQQQFVTLLMKQNLCNTQKNNVIYKEKPIYIRVPYRVPAPTDYRNEKLIIKHIPIPMHIPVIRNITKFIEVPIVHKVPVPIRNIQRIAVPYPIEKIIIRNVSVPVEVPVIRNVTQYVQVPVKVPYEVKIPVPVKVIQRVPQPYPVEKIVNVTVPQPYPVIKTIKVPVKVPFEVKVQQPPKIITRQIPIYVPQKPKVIIKQIPVWVTRIKPTFITRQVPVMVMQPPRIVFKQVPVKVAVPVRVSVPIEVKVPVIKRIPIKVPVPVIKYIRKYVRVPIPVQVPMKVPVYIKVPYIRNIVKYIQVPVKVPYKVKVPVQVPIKIPVRIVVVKKVPVIIKIPVIKNVTKYIQVPVRVPYEVKVPVPFKVVQQMPCSENIQSHGKLEKSDRTLYKQIPVYIPQKPIIIVKKIPVYLNDSTNRNVIIKQVPVYVKMPPKILIKEMPTKVMVQSECKRVLPQFSANIDPNMSPLVIVDSIDFSGFSDSEVMKFKQDLRNLIVSLKSYDGNDNCFPKIPKLTSACAPYNEIIEQITLGGNNLEEFKQDLLNLFTSRDECFNAKCLVPMLSNIPQTHTFVQDSENLVKSQNSSYIEQYSENFKQLFPNLMHHQQYENYTSSTIVPVLAIPEEMCVTPENLIKSISFASVTNSVEMSINVFKDNLKKLLLQQRDCFLRDYKQLIPLLPANLCMPFNYVGNLIRFAEIPAAYAGNYLKRFVLNLIKEQRLCNLRSETEKIRENESIKLNRLSVDCPKPPPQVIPKLPVLSDFCISIEDLVNKTEFERISPFDLTNLEMNLYRFKENLQHLLLGQRECCVKYSCPTVKPQIVPILPQPSCNLPNYLVNEIQFLNVSNDLFNLNEYKKYFKQDLVNLLLHQQSCYIEKPSQTLGGVQKIFVPYKVIERIPQPFEKIVEKKIFVKVPNRESRPIYIRVPIKVPIEKFVIKQVPIYISQQPKVIIRRIPMFISNQTSPKVIIKQVPVLVQSKPKVIIKHIPVNVSVPFKVPVMVIKKVKVPVVQHVPYPIKKIVEVPIIRNVTKLVQVPVKVPIPIVKPILRYVPVQVPVIRNVTKYVQVPVKVPYERKVPVYVKVPIEIVKRIPYAVERVVIKKVPYPIRIPIAVKIPIRVIQRISIPYPVEKIINVTVPVKVPFIIRYPIEVPVRVPVLQEPKIVYKEKPIYIEMKPRIITKQIPVYICNKPQTIFRQIAVPVPTEPKIIIKQVPVKVPIYVNGATKIQRVHIPIKVPVPVKFPMEVKVPIHVPVKIPLDSATVCKTVVVKQPIPVPYRVAIKVPSPPKVIYTQVPIYVKENPNECVYKPDINNTNVSGCESRVIIKQVPVLREVIKLVPTPQPPKVIIKKVPINIDKTSYDVLNSTVNRNRNVSSSRTIVTNVPCDISTGVLLPKLPVPKDCYKIFDYINNLEFSSVFPSENVATFKHDLYRILLKQLSCECNFKRPLTCEEMLTLQNEKLAELQKGFNYMWSKFSSDSLVDLVRNNHLYNLNNFNKFNKYRRIVNRLKHTLGNNNCLENKTLLNDMRRMKQSAVPIPLMHVLHKASPSFPIRSYQYGMFTQDMTKKTFTQHLHEVYQHTQEALTHCMKAVMAQTLTNHQYNLNYQDTEFAENKIKFLNSIIVDMQKKNEDMKAHIELLESGYSPAVAAEFEAMEKPMRAKAPRLYCDICEVFDQHETEDCPQQNNEFLPNDNSLKKEVPNRPYCEVCEAFGHATEDCQDFETF